MLPGFWKDLQKMSLLEENFYIKKIDGLMWYLIRTMPRSENHADQFFSAYNIPHYLPKYNKHYINTVTAKNGKKYQYNRLSALVPMFPGYIFAALDLDGISETRRNRHIIQICLNQNYPEEKLISDLNTVQDFEFLARNNRIEVKQELKIGERVIITCGPFKGWEGIVERRADNNLVWIRMETIGFSMAMEIAAADCEIA